LESLVNTFFENGGNHLHISVLDKQELLDALDEPEKHTDLMVRVGGFCARFVNLSRESQEDIIARSEY
jgi:formate C-acetyltransferase